MERQPDFVDDYTMEELDKISKVYHDLGKVGDMDSDHYIPKNFFWVKNQGKLYVNNPDIPFYDTT